MNSEIINICSNRNLKRWLIVRDDGRLTLHTEHNVYDILDGYRQTTDPPISLDEVRARNPCIAAAAEGVLEAMRARAMGSSSSEEERDGRHGVGS